MSRLISIICLLAFFSNIESFAKGKPISGDVPKGNKIVDGVQYIYEGSPLFDLEEAPVVAEIDTNDHFITLFVPSIAPRESLYIQFIPSSLFTVTLSAEVSWDEQAQVYVYDYAIISDSGSITPIVYFQIEWWNDYAKLFVPEGWTGGSIYSARVNYWSNILDRKINAGDSLSGIGCESHGPPRLTTFEIWGELNTLDQKGDDEEFGSIYSGVSGKYRGVKGYTIAPWVSPELIEPVDWFLELCNLPVLVRLGYLDGAIQDSIYPTLYKLYDEFQVKENQTLEKLEQAVNNALDTLEPYRNQMQPEAQAFIFENLKYILRHEDIVKFKEYP
jgi:hypothetical protein